MHRLWGDMPAGSSAAVRILSDKSRKGQRKIEIVSAPDRNVLYTDLLVKGGGDGKTFGDECEEKAAQSGI